MTTITMMMQQTTCMTTLDHDHDDKEKEQLRGERFAGTGASIKSHLIKMEGHRDDDNVEEAVLVRDNGEEVE